MLNILYLSHTGSIVGGGENQLLGLIKNLDRSLYNPIVLCPDSGEFSRELQKLDIPVLIRHLPGWRKIMSYPFRRLAAVRLARLAADYHVGLAHASDSWFNYYAWQVNQALGIPIISHVRTPLTPRQIHKHLFDKFHKVIAISERIKESLISEGIPADKVEVIYDGVDLSRFSPGDEGINRLKQDHPLRQHLVGLVGRIEPSKRQREFIQVAAEVLKVRQDVSFLIIGDPLKKQFTYFREVQRIIHKHGIAEYIVFTGYRRDMPEVLNSLDILVTLSGGSVMMEAMACARPVIMASKARPEELRIVQDGRTGLVVPYDDIYSISGAILSLLEDKSLRDEMGKLGRKRAEELFDMRKTAKLTEAVYERLGT